MNFRVSIQFLAFFVCTCQCLPAASNGSATHYFEGDATGAIYRGNKTFSELGSKAEWLRVSPDDRYRYRHELYYWQTEDFDALRFKMSLRHQSPIAQKFYRVEQLSMRTDENQNLQFEGSGLFGFGFLPLNELSIESLLGYSLVKQQNRSQQHQMTFEVGAYYSKAIADRIDLHIDAMMQGPVVSSSFNHFGDRSRTTGWNRLEIRAPSHVSVQMTQSLEHSYVLKATRGSQAHDLTFRFGILVRGNL